MALRSSAEATTWAQPGGVLTTTIGPLAQLELERSDLRGAQRADLHARQRAQLCG